MVTRLDCIRNTSGSLDIIDLNCVRSWHGHVCNMMLGELFISCDGWKAHHPDSARTGNRLKLKNRFIIIVNLVCAETKLKPIILCQILPSHAICFVSHQIKKKESLYTQKLHL